jgi:hypothetical protein
MTLPERIDAFSTLGAILRNALAGSPGAHATRLNDLVITQHLKNPWFTPDNVRMSLNAIADQLTPDNLHKWTGAYRQLQKPAPSFRVAVIMAGNIPLVGFHDFLTVLISGNIVIVKKSSKDPDLIVFIKDLLIEIDGEFSTLIRIAEGTLPEFDAVIATGSDNTSRYFEYYFGKYPHIIRRNRSSIAILTGDESDAELKALGTDIFSYFGLGCRNVSKIYIPEGYDLSSLAGKWEKFSNLISHQKYANNYDYNKAVFIVNREKFTDTGFVLLKEDQRLSSPVAVLYYEYYNGRDNAEHITGILSEKLQCIAGRGHVPFGSAQSPALWDYADGVDTLEFILKKNTAGIL